MKLEVDRKIKVTTNDGTVLELSEDDWWLLYICLHSIFGQETEH